MNRVKLHWADGRVEPRDDLSPTGDTLRLPHVPFDRRFHIFRGTDEVDEDGDDVYREEPPTPDETT